jgi:hypothetical protein
MAVRTALLTSALMVVAAMAWADEPSAPDAKTEAAAASAAEKPAEQAAAASETRTASVVTENDRKIFFKPPAGYKPKRINGEQVWCAKQVILGSRFPKQDCRNEAELREMIRVKESMRDDMTIRTRTCTTANGACGSLN